MESADSAVQLAEQHLHRGEPLLAYNATHLALRSGDAGRRTSHLRTGFGLYQRAFESARERHAYADAYYAGINAATMAVLLGELGRGREIAREVAAICKRTEIGLYCVKPNRL